MAYFLAIDTTTTPFSVSIGDESIIYAEEIRYNYAELAGHITLMIQKCCNFSGISLNDLSGILIARGPGSYTGLRIGYSVAKGLCMSLDIKLIEVDSFQALAQEAARQFGTPISIYCAALDARRNEVYMSIFDHFGKLLYPVSPCLLPILLSDLVGDIKPDAVYCLGDAADKINQQLGPYNYFTTDIEITSSLLFNQLGIGIEHSSFEEIAAAEPYYLKPPNITVSKKKPFDPNIKQKGI